MKIKQLPEDFYVREELDLAILPKGDFTYFLLKKKDWSNLDAINKIASVLHSKPSRFNIAGMKDKNAVTEQYVSAFKLEKEDLENIRIKDIEIRFLGYGSERLSLGQLKCNFFRIVVRDLKERVKLEDKTIINYFGEQRFGTGRNYLVGKALIKKDFKEACRILNLKVEGNDYIKALRFVDRKDLRFRISAYQSYLWNKVVSKLKKEYDEVPILGFLTEFKDKEVENVYSKIMEEESIKKEDFIIKQMPELTSEGSSRKMFLEVSDLDVEWDKDELNKGKFKAIVSFKLGKGQYATEVIKELFSQ
ncbi:MAG TPA: tRNA pseudouridine(13) synthase TruD [Candidatus Nanoarchaeia archaeon]|nr:tRNA pseudouridine(13) synthase TruD [Candidatus Nanoarchaeia archaeon]